MADRQRQEEIYQHQSKSQGGQAEGKPSLTASALPPRLPPGEGGGCALSASVSGTSVIDAKQRVYQAQVAEGGSYLMETAQVGDAKHFIGGIEQFNATHH